MSRLIDADDLIEFIDIGHLRNPMEICFSERDVVDMLESRPIIDAVPVVRCRECKNYVIVDEFDGGKRYMCLVNHFSYLDNDGDNQFCSYGERKEGADHA